MNTKEPETAVNTEEELRRLRDKTDKGEIGELRHGLLGGYRSRDVASYVERLKGQLQTAERTFKSRIAELAQEKEKLKGEYNALAARLAFYESAAKEEHTGEADGDGGGAGELIRIADENIAELHGRVDALETELRHANEQKQCLYAGRDGLQAERDELRARLEAEAKEHSERLEESRKEHKALHGQMESLARANGDLADQLEISKQNILESISEKDALAEINEELREALNSLIVKADAAVDENDDLNARFAAEREKSQRYQALYDSLSGMLARVRTAGRLLDEKVEEMEKTLCWGNGQASKPTTGAHKRTKAELLDFTEGKSAAVKDLIGELKSIRGGLAQ
jgi:chromosome segregation ATPase